MQSTLVDAGPLIALFDKGEREHMRVVRFLKEGFRGALITTWPVIVEAAYMLGKEGRRAMFIWIARGAVAVENMSSADLSVINSLMDKYADLPMDFADASLLWLANRTNTVNVLTLERRGFAVYRLKNERRFRGVL
ncbi:MAG: type II toxin-antitoxin system VapC family toxin [Gammaproteobacteria bacterium]